MSSVVRNRPDRAGPIKCLRGCSWAKWAAKTSGANSRLSADPKDFDFLVERLEFGGAGEEPCLSLAGESGGESIGIGEPPARLEASREPGDGTINAPEEMGRPRLETSQIRD